MTSPSAASDLLMCAVSFARSPVAPDLESLSEPAKSMRLSTPSTSSSVAAHAPWMRSVKTQCERDERSFIAVLPMERALSARSSSCCSSSREPTSTVVAPTTVAGDLPSCLMSSLGGGFCSSMGCALRLGLEASSLSRSCSISLYTSSMDAVMLNSQPLAASASELLKMCASARGIRPAPSSSALLLEPSIVWVLPEPVWPYAKMHTL
mmetsp:Transcript_6586/g.26868  ORF Transcript_6586/g.26868 Transcript_6586/m.26868 type:complete len:208 (+) Transcript_6586:237-860(+)